MKSIVCLIMAVLILSIPLFTGCENRKEATPKETVTTEDVKKEVGEAFETAAEFTQQQKEEYQREVERRIMEIDSKLQDIETRADMLKEEARNELNKEIENLEKKKADAKQKLAQLKSATGTAWEDIKTGLDKAFEDMDEAYQKAISRFK